MYRHSTAHLLALAVLELFPETKLGIGPPTEAGFYYDFQRETPFTPEDLEKIEAKMWEIAEARSTLRAQALAQGGRDRKVQRDGRVHEVRAHRGKGRRDVFRVHARAALYRLLPRPACPFHRSAKAFKVLSTSGAYWKGDEKNHRMQRIYGTAFFSPKELDEYLKRLEEAKKRDHRKLGQELDLFSIQDLAGPGLIFFHPKGGIIRKELEDWMRDEYLKRGYSLVYTPHVARADLWKTSGHYNFYAENMFKRMELDDAEYQLKPMNCPFHILIYRDRQRSLSRSAGAAGRTRHGVPL